MFESFQILGVLLLAVITVMGLLLGVILAICARRNKRLHRPAVVVLSGFVLLFLFVSAIGILMFQEFYLNEHLVFACRDGDVAEAEWLLSLGASPNAKGVKGMDDALGAASEAGHRELVELLLSRGAKVGHRNFYGKNALQRAEEAGHTDIVTLLEQEEPSP